MFDDCLSQVTAANITIINSTFSNITATDTAGALTLSPASPIFAGVAAINILDTHFANNKAQGNGGVVFLSGCNNVFGPA
jgi:hypothetical protein